MADLTTSAHALAGSLSGTGVPPPDIDAELVAVLRQRYASLPADQVESLCLSASAWVSGQREEAKRHSAWKLVLSGPRVRGLPVAVEHTTAETLLQLLNSAESRCYLLAPFIDSAALDILSGTLLRAIQRGVRVELGASTSGLRFVRGTSLGRVLNVWELPAQAGWPHLKVVSADGVAAYLGSANLTANALSGKNVELGVLVHGPAVLDIDNAVEWLRDHRGRNE